MSVLVQRPIVPRTLSGSCTDPIINLKRLPGQAPSISSLPRRPAFRIGEQFVPLLQPIKPQIPLPPKKFPDRFFRPNFRLRGPKPRALQTIQSVEKLRVKQEGIKVRFDDKTLGKIPVVKLDAEGNPVLDSSGQPILEEQKVNLGALAQLLQGDVRNAISKIEALDRRVRSGATGASLARQTLMTSIVAILSRITNLENIGAREMESISRAISSVGAPSVPSEARISNLVDDRFVTSDTWFSDGGVNVGLINLFLLANFSENPRLSSSKPVIGVSGRPIGLRAVSEAIRGREGRPPKVLDLVSKRMFQHLDEALDFARATELKTPEFESGFPSFVTPGASGPSPELRTFDPSGRPIEFSIPSEFKDEFPFAPGDRSVSERLAEEASDLDLLLLEAAEPVDPTSVSEEDLADILRRQPPGGI